MTLSYTPTFVGKNHTLNHIYVGSVGNSFVEVRDSDSGKLLGTLTLSGVTIYSVAGDYTKGAGHLYVLGASGGTLYLYRITDTY